MRLTLEEIWKLADLLEEQQDLSTSGNILAPVVAEAEMPERVLRMPALFISEEWGKGESGTKPPDRIQLEQIVATATKGADTPFKKLQAIQNQMTKIAAGEAIKNPRRILSQILLLETLNRLFKSFSPSGAGFINEAFLSVFYGSFQKPAGKANVEKEIGDITDNGTPVSVKTISESKAIVKGSTANLVASINKSATKQVYFDIYIKTGGDEVGSLTVQRFVVNKDNINEFLNIKSNTIKDINGNLIMPESSLKEDVFSDSDMTQQADDYFNSQISLRKNISDEKKAILAFQTLKLNNYKMPRTGDNPSNFRQFLDSLNDGTLAKLQNILAAEPRSDQIVALSQDIAASEISKREPREDIKAEFELAPSHWKKFARRHGQENITINFSDNDINKILQNAVKSLDNSITEIFNNLTDFTKYLQSYLTSTDESRTKDGVQAMNIANTLPETTKTVVNKTSEQDLD
jgi:hypothetical protein